MSIPSSLLTFLSDLKENNTREWFGENKDRFLEQKSAFDQFTIQLIVDNEVMGTVQHISKKRAEQMVSEQACIALGI